MKKTRKISKFLLTAILMLSIVFCFTACTDDSKPLSGNITIVINENPQIEYTLDLQSIDTSEGVVSVLKYLRDNRGLDCNIQQSAYGAHLTKIGALIQDETKGVYIYIYTSVEKDFDVSMYANTIEYNGRFVTSSGLGLSEMTIESDCIIFFDTIKI